MSMSPNSARRSRGMGRGGGGTGRWDARVANVRASREGGNSLGGAPHDAPHDAPHLARFGAAHYVCFPSGRATGPVAGPRPIRAPTGGAAAMSEIHFTDNYNDVSTNSGF